MALIKPQLYSRWKVFLTKITSLIGARVQISPPDATVHFYEKVKDLNPKTETSNYANMGDENYENFNKDSKPEVKKSEYANVGDESYENFNKKAEKNKEESHYLVPDVFNPYIEPDVLPE